MGDSVGVGLLRFSRNIDRGRVDFVLWRKKYIIPLLFSDA